MIKFDNEPTLYTIEEAIEIVKLSYPTMLNYLRDGKLVGRKIGRKWYISEDVLKELALGKTGGSSVVSSIPEAPKG